MRTIPRDAVGRLLAEVADTAILPRYQNLRDDDILDATSLKRIVMANDYKTICTYAARMW